MSALPAALSPAARLCGGQLGAAPFGRTMIAPYRPISTCRSPCVPLKYARVPGEPAVNAYVTEPPGAASCVSSPATPPDAATLKPGNRIDVLPPLARTTLVRLTR